MRRITAICIGQSVLEHDGDSRGRIPLVRYFHQILEPASCSDPLSITLEDIQHARALAVLGDSITTVHISPAGRTAPDILAGQYLRSLGVQPPDFISFGARRGNHELMARGTFSNPRLRNQLVAETEGGFTRYTQRRGDDHLRSRAEIHR